jgi:cardiolipin synthase
VSENVPVRVKTSAHELTLYPDPAPLFAELERTIPAASRRVWLETYIYRDDALGRPFAQLLVAAARRGADVRLLYDPQGSRGARRSFFEALEGDGVAVRAYRPWRAAPRRWTYRPRDHGRILIVDDAAYTGGINWGKEWLPRSRGGEEWHDVSIGMVGPVVTDAEAVFSRRWSEAQEEDGIADHVSEARPDVRLLADSPAPNVMILNALCVAVARAKRRVWIENSYCVPPPALLSALREAVARGVDVQLLLPGETDLPLIQTIARGEYARWIASGLGVWEYAPRVLHSKFALVDDEWSTLGTFNAMTPGVMWSNETNVVVCERAFVTALARVFTHDSAHSTPVTPAWLARRSRLVRLRERAASGLYRTVERAAIWLAGDPSAGGRPLTD